MPSFQVIASNPSWQNGPVVAPGQSVTLSVPLGGNGQPQEWGVIDPANRGLNTVTGNGVQAGGGATAPGFQEGALIVKDGASQFHTFPTSNGSLMIATPGQVSFMANDYGDTGVVIQFGFHGARFTDNTGQIVVNW
jgi:hypothetical protein